MENCAFLSNFKLVSARLLDYQEQKGKEKMTEEQSKSLEYLVEKAKRITMSEQQISAQRKSFAYGNSHFENPLITKEMIENEAKKLGF